MHSDVAAHAFAALTRYRSGKVDYPTFVLELERAVDAAELSGHSKARELRRAWGQLEILNALTEGTLSEDDKAEVARLADQFSALLQ